MGQKDSELTIGADERVWMEVMKPLVMNALGARRSRRSFLGAVTFGAAGVLAPGVFAEELTRTARVEEGPFYPDKLPLDTDNDLLIVNDSITPAVGEVTHLSGRLLDARGDPIKNALIEIWQVDSTGTYLRARGSRPNYDRNFQGFGRFLTSSSGEYYFRTIKPVAYNGRPAPHIHFAVKMKGREKWTTQLFVKGDPGNERDGLYRRIREGKLRESVTAEFLPLKNSRIGELAARFDIVMGNAAEREDRR
jgi:protocatechuate 3,4-dioxygenase beta subunit